ncbi:TetR/AcrR family transcriptional regulator [Neobacillus sp. OS1-2]|uniref:TetR/AcrR family transcriptional regulator n=1 Tax=Neobacillus sp. OS1-2 TaxID=3070680 RepID=UPI0027E08E79|nr:TetR/AcrR family transcriptional regulator [Neobacillus sp. OS1-2]WML38114.1 TetR/AcrR family transcriptional regulator [Neobacillus sp. OS1-2]
MVQQRRRGNELKEAIYISAIELLESEGYKAITFQNIAKKAQTSRSVLYRSWSSPFIILYEAVRWKTFQDGNGSVGNASFDTGSLRGDLLALCQHWVRNSLAFSSEFLKGFLTEIIENPEFTYLSEKVTVSNLLVIEKIIERASIRGEIKHEVSNMVKLLPFEILRYHLVFMKDAVDDPFIKQLVDHVLLPAMTNGNKVER